MSDQVNFAPPIQTSGDLIHTFVRATLSFVPVVGSPAVELFNSIITPPVQRRWQDWATEVADCLIKLKEEGRIDFGGLASNPAFQDAFLLASQSAVRNSQKEKQEALKNAVINSALPNPPEESKQRIFMGLVDSLTVWHLKILRFLADPQRAFRDQGLGIPQVIITTSISQLLVQCYPELTEEKNLYEKICKDLNFHSLTGTDSFHAMMTGQGAFAKRTSDLGVSVKRSAF